MPRCGEHSSTAFEAEGPVLIRYPKDECGADLQPLGETLVKGRGVFVHENGEETLLVSAGGTFREVLEAGNLLSRKGIASDLYNLRFIKPIDESYIVDIFSRYRRIFLYEDGAETGGIGEYIASIIQKNSLNVRYSFVGVPDLFLTQATRSELFKLCGLDRETIARQIEADVRESSDEPRRIIRFSQAGDQEKGVSRSPCGGLSQCYRL